MSYDIDEKELICLNCPIIPDCDESNPDCPYQKEKLVNGLSIRQVSYQKLKQNPTWYKKQKERWRRNYLKGRSV